MRVVEYLTMLTKKYAFLERRCNSSDDTMSHLDCKESEIDKIRDGGESKVRTISSGRMKELQTITKWGAIK